MRNSNFLWISLISFWAIGSAVAETPNQNAAPPQMELKVNQQDPSLAAGKAAAHGTSGDEASAVPAEKALQWLKNGNTRFIKGHLRKDGQSQKDRDKIAVGQKPHSIILSCSDSRVPPEIVFDQKLGEIFVIRTAGEALDSTSIASIEYAVAHLGSRLLVVMGHSSCGAIKETLANLQMADTGSPHLNALIADIAPRLKSFEGSKQTSKDLVRESTLNAHVVAQDLPKRSKIIADAVAAGKLTIHSALYHVKYGKVVFN